MNCRVFQEALNEVFSRPWEQPEDINAIEEVREEQWCDTMTPKAMASGMQ